VRISDQVVAAIEAHARQTAPEECCGLLLGTGSAIMQSARAGNVSAEPLRRYEIAPREHFAAIRRARNQGLDVIGAYHSHPLSAPEPSEIDRQQAFGNFIFVIVSLRGAAAEMAAWRLDGGNFIPVPLVRNP